MTTTISRPTTIEERIRSFDWPALQQAMDDTGYATMPPLLTPDECRDLRALYDEDHHFRSRIDMARHRFGVGEYKYFAAPLPPVIQELRAAFYPHLAAIANRWMDRLGDDVRYPPDLSGFLDRCHAHGQTKPTPLLLRYEAGGYNCLHQDIYGDVVFPLQLTCFLSRRGVDYEGGDFLLVEQRPRAQSRGEAIATEQGEIVIFPTRHRPLEGTRGVYRAAMRHGVSRVRSGSRYTLGVIFHDAK